MSDINLIISATDQASGPLGNIQGKLAGVTSAAATTGGGFTGMGGKIKAALGVAAAGFAVFKGITAINDRIAEMDDLAKRARAVGAATEEGFAGFQVASQLLAEGGLSAQEADRAFNNLQLRLAEGAKGNKAYAEIMGKLGDSVMDANGDLKTAPELFESVASAVQDGTLSIDEASKILGQRVGPKIVGIFQDLATNGTSVEEALKDVAANTNIVPLDAAKNAEVFGDTMERIRQVLGKVMTEAITPLLPLLVQLAENALAALPPIIEKVQKGFQAAQPIFEALGVVLTDVLFPIIGFVADALISLLEAVGPLYEKALPVLKTTIEAVSNAIEVIVEKIKGFIDGVKDVGETISSITGGVKDKVSDMASGVTESVTGMADNMKNKALEATEGVKGFFSDMYQKVVGGSIVPDMRMEVLEEFDLMMKGMQEKSKKAAEDTVANMKMMAMNLQGVIAPGGLTDDTLQNVDDTVKILSDLKKEEQELERITKRNIGVQTGLDVAFKRGEVSLSKYIETAEAFGIELGGTMTSRGVAAAQQISDSFGQMGMTISSTMTDVVFGMKDGFEAMQDIALSVVKQIVNALIQNFIVSPLIRNIQNSIMGIGGGGAGAGGFMASMGPLGALFGIGAALGGFLADGGPAKAGTPYVVGERGPELFVPNTSGTVVANEELAMVNQQPLNVTFQIQAIDTQQGVEFLLDNKQVITGVVQDAYNRRGEAGPLG